MQPFCSEKALTTRYIPKASDFRGGTLTFPVTVIYSLSKAGSLFMPLSAKSSKFLILR